MTFSISRPVPERVSNGDDELSGSKRRELAQLCDRQPGSLGPNDRQIGCGVAPDKHRPQDGAIGERDAEIGRLVPHVAVGQDIPVRRKNHAGPGTYTAPHGATLCRRQMRTTPGPTRSTTETTAREYESSRSRSSMALGLSTSVGRGCAAGTPT